MTTGEKILFQRKKSGLTQKALGELCNMPDSQIRQYELGKVEPKLENIRRIASALQISISDLVADWSEFSSDEIKKDIIKGSKEDSWEYSKAEEYFEYSRRKLEDMLIEDFHLLNASGQMKAMEHIKLLTKVPEYCKKSNAPSQD